MEPGPAGSVTDSRSKGHKFKFQLGHITFVEINHHIISLAFHSRRAVAIYWQKYVHKYWLTA